jgi:hypothetical protein
MSTPQTFEQRALSAGAALRTAFFEGEAMTAPTVHRPPSVEQPRPERPRGRAVLAAAAALAVVAAGAAVVLTSGEDQRALPPAEAPQEEVLTGLLGLPQFPIRLTVPTGLYEVDEDAGSRAFRPVSRQPGGVVVSALRSVNGVAAADLPADVTAAFATRTDVVVSDERTATVAGRPAQGFTLAVAPGAAPSDLWCPVVEQLCFKLDPGLTMDVLVVPTAAEPLWIAVEHTTGSAQEVRGLGQALVASIALLDPAGIEVDGASLVLPTGWRGYAQTDRYAQAADPQDRDFAGVNLVAVGSVVGPDGARTAAPLDLLAWLKARPQIRTTVLEVLPVGSAQSRLVRVDPVGGNQTLWCGAAAGTTVDSSCFNTGPGTVLYLLVPTGSGTLVLERYSDAPADGLTDAEVQEWADAHKELVQGLTLGS